MRLLHFSFLFQNTLPSRLCPSRHVLLKVRIHSKHTSLEAALNDHGQVCKFLESHYRVTHCTRCLCSLFVYLLVKIMLDHTV